VLPFALEALIVAGRLDEAEGLLDRFEREAAAIDSPWARGIAHRLAALLASARGELDRALAAIHAAETASWPFEHGRTFLAAGRILRRMKRKAAARRSLEQAAAIFDVLPAPLWAERAREELARLGKRPAARHDLTETERRVAELAAQGMKNREVAAQLFVSPKTVEANLSRIYRKLGIHSRAELGARLAGRNT
jgi:DNA-binding CsgD family transcriptional regulator